MNRREFNRTALQGVALLLAGVVDAAQADASSDKNNNFHYRKGSIISEQVVILDAQGLPHHLRDLLRVPGKKLNILFVFGGGAMGSSRSTGGIWCPDSFEDLHIYRTLLDNYGDRVGFIAVACPPVFHSKSMGFVDRVFLDYPPEAVNFKAALAAFISSTLTAVETGIIPHQPYFDPRFRMLMSPQEQESLPVAYGSIPSWQGAFRAADETQSYGVPNFWMLGAQGEVLVEPFRGNVYHPHGGTLKINYSLSDIRSAIELALG